MSTPADTAMIGTVADISTRQTLQRKSDGASLRLA
jgi:hypothetical protein